ncbi:hypothetical protein L3Q82_011998, partial [Scortum barcoo]
AESRLHSTDCQHSSLGLDVTPVRCYFTAQFVRDQDGNPAAAPGLVRHGVSGSAANRRRGRDSISGRLREQREEGGRGEINAGFKLITTMPLQSRFLSQLDLLSESLLRVFAKRSGEQGKKLKDMAAMMTDDIDALIKGLCIYLDENPDVLVQEYMVSV